MKFLQRIKAISSFNSSKSRRKLNSQSNNQRCDIKTFNFENGNTFQSKRSSIQNEIVEANNFLDRNLKNKIRISKYFRMNCNSSRHKQNTKIDKFAHQHCVGKNIDVEKFLYDLTTNRQISTPIAACPSQNIMCTYSELKLLKSLKKKHPHQSEEKLDLLAQPKLQISDLIYCKFKEKEGQM